MVEGLAERLRGALAQLAVVVAAMRRLAAVVKSEAPVVIASATGTGNETRAPREACVRPGKIGKLEHPTIRGIYPCQTNRIGGRNLGNPFAADNPFGNLTLVSIQEYPFNPNKQKLSVAFDRASLTRPKCEYAGIVTHAA